MLQNESFSFSPTIYAQNLWPNLNEAFTQLIRHFNMHQLQSGYLPAFYTERAQKKVIQKLKQVSLKSVRIGNSRTSLYKKIRKHIEKSGTNAALVFISGNPYYFGLGALMRIDAIFGYLRLTTGSTFKLGVIVPPKKELSMAVHNVFTDEIVKTIMYANGFYVKKIYPFVYSTRRRVKSGKSTSGQVGFIFFADKEKIYNVDCLMEIESEPSVPSLFFRTEAYVSWLLGEGMVDRFKRWKSYRKFFRGWVDYS